MQVAAAEANVKSVQTNLRNSIFYAPFDGTIGISSVKLGSAVTAGQTLLNTVSSDNPMGVDCAVDEKQINRFVQLLQKNPKDQDSIFTMVLPDQSIYSTGSGCRPANRHHSYTRDIPEHRKSFETGPHVQSAHQSRRCCE
jgi:hypothetical protein